MATLASYTDVQSECNLAQVLEAQLTPHIASAELEIQTILGSTRWTAVATPSSPYAAADKAALKKAEALLAGAIALPLLNTATGGAGIFASQVTGGGGMATSYISEGQAQQRAAGLRARALSILAPYLPGLDSVADAEDNPTGGVDLAGFFRLTPCGGR